MATLDELLERLDADGGPTCDACFLECSPWGGQRQYPCSDELREWAREHRDSPGWQSDGEEAEK